MVTKQQQLEWLAENITAWNSAFNFVIMSVMDVGVYAYPGDKVRHEITYQEWQQERDKMQKQAAKPAQPAPDNSWHERGDLPPVGCECEWVDESGVDGPAGSLYPCVGDTVSVCAHRQTPGGNVIAIFTWAPGDDGLRVAASRMPEDFRPIRTEREKAIDEMLSVYAGKDDGKPIHPRCKLLAEMLYDAGYRKVNP